MDQMLREKALEKSIQLHALWLHKGEIACSAELQVQDILYIANLFHDFLKGDTK